MRPRRILKKLGISLVSLVVVFALAEVVARIAEPGPFSMLDRNPFEQDEAMDYVQVPGFRGRWEDTWYEINSIGLRGPELPPAEEQGLYRIAALGDSCTAGKGVLERESWPRVLQAMLADQLGGAPRPVVANLGVVGYSGTQYLGSLRRTGRTFRPEVVIVGYNLNDFPNSIEAVDQRVYHERKLRSLIPVWLRDGLSRTAIYRYARTAYYEFGKQGDWEKVAQVAADMATNVEDPAVLARERRYIEEIVAESRAIGAEVLVLLFPYESQVYVEAYEAGPVQGLAGICAELEVPFLDVALVLRGALDEDDRSRGLFLRGDRYHPSARGYRVVAEAVLAVIREQGWLPGDEH